MKTIKFATFAVVAGSVVLGLAGPANAVSDTMYGDPVAAAKYWQQQQYDDCVLMASADVIGEITGVAPAEEAIIAKAQSTPSTDHPGSIYTKPADTNNPNSGMGTSMSDVPTLLGQYKIKAILSDKYDAAETGIPAGMAGLKQALGSGHKVIVSINAELIWHEPVDEKDENGNPVSDHAVVVTGVDVANRVVHLNDSGSSEGRDAQIPMGLFIRAWDTSDDLMIVTT
jgi:hypothetical protein